MLTPPKPFKLRASYTHLNNWASGRWEQAIKGYFKLEKFTSPQMEEGKRYHEEWAKHIQENMALPECFGSTPLLNPVTEKFMSIRIFDWLDLAGFCDCIDDTTIYEFKTGMTPSSEYINTFQTAIYGLLARRNGFKVKMCVLPHYNQYDKTADVSAAWLTPGRLEEALKWVIKNSKEMHSYILENGLHELYGANRK